MTKIFADILWKALALFLGRVHDWVFDPERAARSRFKNRERWWAYKLKADATKDPRDNMRAEWWRIHFSFETPPITALARGDLQVLHSIREQPN